MKLDMRLSFRRIFFFVVTFVLALSSVAYEIRSFFIFIFRVILFFHDDNMLLMFIYTTNAKQNP